MCMYVHVYMYICIHTCNVLEKNPFISLINLLKTGKLKERGASWDILILPDILTSCLKWDLKEAWSVGARSSFKIKGQALLTSEETRVQKSQATSPEHTASWQES